MATFVSPSGNPEIWDEKPDGYFTVEEWDELNPPPPLPPETIAEIRKQEIYMELGQLDTKSIRSLRAIETGYSTDEDVTKLQEIELNVKALRDELAELTKPPVLTRRARTRKVETEPEAEITEKE